MIYYYETAALYDLHCDALHELLAEYKESTGEWPQYVTDTLNDATLFKNAMVWFGAELVAYELVECSEETA
jgi:hypothetical protein